MFFLPCNILQLLHLLLPPIFFFFLFLPLPLIPSQMLVEIDSLRDFDIGVWFRLMHVHGLDLLEIELRVELQRRLLLEVGSGRRDVREHDWPFDERRSEDVEDFDRSLVPSMLFDLVIASQPFRNFLRFLRNAGLGLEEEEIERSYID